MGSMLVNPKNENKISIWIKNICLSQAVENSQAFLANLFSKLVFCYKSGK